MALPSEIDAAARAGKETVVVGQVFANFLDTVEDATPAQWATFTVKVITTARQVGMGRDELLRVLDIVGITGSPPVIRHTPAGKTVPLKGVCSVCGRRRDLQQDGTLRSHKRGGKHCPGRYKLPAGEPRAVAS